MAGNDREPIGRKGKPTRPVKQKVSRRRYEDDDDYDDYDDYEDEEPMPRKGKGKGRKPVSYTHLYLQCVPASDLAGREPANSCQAQQSENQNEARRKERGRSDQYSVCLSSL